MSNSKKKESNKETGWATIELIALMPILVGIFSFMAYFTKLAIIQLHLTNSVRVVTRMLAVNELPACSSAKTKINSLFEKPVPDELLDVDCTFETKSVQVDIVYHYQSDIPFFDLISRDIKASSYAVREI